MTILTDARVVQGDQVVEGGWVRWERERLAEVGPGHLLSTGAARPADGWSSPGRLANLAVLEENLTVRAVLYRGSWVDGRTP